MKNRIYFLISCLFIAHSANAQTSLIGTKVADLTFKKVMNDKDSTYKLSDFAGKAVIIDFWATWCAPCVAAFPMMDSMQNIFASDLTILTITSDDAARISKFLTKFKTNLPIVIDPQNEFGKIFPHRSIPHTIFIDKQGIIKAVTTSENINKETIQKLIKGEALNIVEKIDNMDFDPNKNTLSGTPNVLNQITLMSFIKGASSMSTQFQNGRMVFYNLMPQRIYERLNDFPLITRSIWETDKKKYEWSEGNAICVEIIAPNKTEKEAKEALINYLKSNIALKCRIEEKEVKVRILRKIEKNTSLIIAKIDEKPIFSSNRNGCDYRNVPFKAIANYIEERLNIPIIDETELTEKYNLKLVWENENKNKIYEELKKIGLELIDDKRTIKMLVFYE